MVMTLRRPLSRWQPIRTFALFSSSYPPIARARKTGVYSMGHLILLDADTDAGAKVAEHFLANAFLVTVVADFRKLRHALAKGVADALLVNIDNPENFHDLRELTRITPVPVIVASARLLDEEHKVRGFEAGAADYVHKSMGLRELEARIQGSIRRNRLVTADRTRRSYAFGDCKLTVRDRRFSRPGVSDAVLTVAEFNLIIAFLNAPRQVLSREKLLNASRVNFEEIYDRSLDALVMRLRRRIEIDPSRPRLIRTVRGKGYIFDVGVDVEPR
ncbi:winged helix-turn-helix domain-containing protein [Rhizobium sp. Root1220]|uniref:winged helix-turn-helix domain-containing protein n=1 Tax=Rhizobium sp. Root1220 TaxID=1736432 RepID=UPI0006F1DFD3|nr:winged helix-turn-helix domain-containing protein [Rhizobium sp. Root1220]KQV73251.1 hypothetical protein ASC90_07590 [Rhizobium sp. Root1220]